MSDDAEEIERLTAERDEEEARANRLADDLDEARDEIADLKRELQGRDLDEAVRALIEEHNVKDVLEAVVEYVRKRCKSRKFTALCF